MTRLFLRFYSGVILVLFIAWLIQVYVFRGTTETENIAVIEDVLGGGALSARDAILEAGEANFDQTIAEVRSRFAYPVNIVKRTDRPMPPHTTARVARGEAVLHAGKIDVALTGTGLLVELGPIPRLAGPSRGDVLLGLGSILLLAAGAIAILMRPIARHFRSVERAALAIADGNFSARIDGGKRSHTLPIVGAFNAMAQRVENSLRSQKELLQVVSHELRTPLARIKFATELVRSAEDEAKRNERLDLIDNATDKLDELVGELLDYTRLDEGTEVANRETVVADEIVAEAVALYCPMYPDIQFTMNASSVPVELTTYRAGIVRAIGNLVSNAGKYAKSQVRITVTERDDQAVIAVDDDGAGIAEADRDLVFEPFKRLPGNSQPGAGLGLALVRRICRRLHGDVTLTSSPLGGAKFQIQLPKDLQSDTRPIRKRN